MEEVVVRPKQNSTPISSSSTLFDSHEIRAINQDLERAINQQHPSVGPTKSHQQTSTPTTMWIRSSPWNGTGGSALYDSFELKAVTRQLSRVLQAQERVSPYLGYLASPLYTYRRRYMEHLHKETGKTPKRVGCGSWRGERKLGGMEKSGSTGLVPRLWKKIKRTFLWMRKQGY